MIRQTRPALIGLIACVSLFAHPVSAAGVPATSEGAQKLSEVLQKYFGKPAAGETSAVKIVPAGEGYKVAIDPAQLAKPFAGAGFVLSSAPWEMTLTEQTDGTWQVKGGGYPPISLKGPNAMDQQIKITNGKLEGVFDPAIGVMRSGTYSVEQVASTMTATGISQTNSYGPTTSTMEGKANGKDAADLAMSGTVGSYLIDMMFNDKPGSKTGATHVSFKAADAKVSATISEFHARGFLDLWAFLVANPNREALAAKQADLKVLLRAALPGFRQLSETVSLSDMAVETTLGKFGAKNLGFGLDISGAVADSHYNIKLKSGSLTIPPALLPAWSTNFVPSSIDLTANASGMDFGAAAREAIEVFTLNADKGISDKDAARIALLLAPTGSVNITIPPSHITSSLLDVKIDGAMQAGPGQVSGKINIAATGVDAALESLKSAMGSDKSAAQAFGALSIAKGLGKPGANGATVWAVEYTPDQKILVNGTPMGGK